MLELWGRKNAYNVQKTTWLLAELGLDYIHHDVGSAEGDLDSQSFLALNPHARIPVLKDKGEIIWESNSIVRYLAAIYSRGDMWAEDALKRSQAERWMDWELCKLQPDFIDLFWGFYRTPAATRDDAFIDKARKRCEEHFEQLDRQLENQDYLAGDGLTIADIACAVCVYRYFNMGFKVQQPPNVTRWYQRLSARHAYASTIMLPFDELRGRLEY